jgi:hypothetical protein
MAGGASGALPSASGVPVQIGQCSLYPLPLFPETHVSQVVALSSNDPSARARAVDLVVAAYRAPVI